MERISRRRAIILAVIVALLLSWYSVRLFTLQIIETDGNTDNTTLYATKTRVKAARGDILDRNGNILVGNRASYDLVFNHYVINSADGTNDALYRLVKKCGELGVEYLDHFPVTKSRPFEYTLNDFTAAWRGYFHSYLTDREMDSDITAPLLVETLRERYKIPDEWSDDEARAVIGLRYEFDLRGVTNLPNYTFMEDVSDANLSALLEMNVPGLIVEASTVREYYTSYAAHILGTMGSMTQEQWQEVNAAYEAGTGAQYYMDAQVGQSGFEAAFETYLHGVDGMRLDEVDKEGTFITREYLIEPQAGNNVETTIDINLQVVAEDALSEIIHWLQNPDNDPDMNQEEAGRDVEGASVVVMEVATGEVLACASYPTYNPQTYNQDYNKILEMDFDPLFNRALQGTYYPGSTYKMTTLIAAMEAGVYQYDEVVWDEGRFDKPGYEGFHPQCLIYTNNPGVTHREVNHQKALEVSCNYFFYEMGYRLTDKFGLTKAIGILDETASSLGLGEYTGVELNEKIGYRANEESKAATHKGLQAQFFKGDLIQACIGQSTNMFSPIQQCVYASTLANEGNRMKATFLNRVVSADYRTLVLENEPVLVHAAEWSTATVAAYKEGMKAVVAGSGGTARKTMTDLPVEICAKTGTAQTGRKGSDDGYFVCFAPAENPEIAIAVHGEKAAHGATLGRVAKAIIQYYFADNDEVGEIISAENRLG